MATVTLRFRPGLPGGGRETGERKGKTGLRRQSETMSQSALYKRPHGETPSRRISAVCSKINGVYASRSKIGRPMRRRKEIRTSRRDTETSDSSAGLTIEIRAVANLKTFFQITTDPRDCVV